MSLEINEIPKEEISTVLPDFSNNIENNQSNKNPEILDIPKNFKQLLNDQDYTEIEREMNKFNMGELIRDEWGITEEGYARIHNLNESRYLLEGTLELIQDIVEKASIGESFDTVIFLDKSARPSSYLYYKMVKVLKEKGHIPDDFKMPQIKYLDIGKSTEGNKISTANTESLLREKLKKEQLGKRVLIVDEFKLSGSTLTKALGDFRRIYGEDIKVTGLYQFRTPELAPFWYYDRDRHTGGSFFRNRTLVVDAENTEKTRKLDGAYNYSVKENREPTIEDKALGEMGTNSEEIKSFKNLTSILPKDIFSDLFYYAYDNEILDRDSKYNGIGEIISRLPPRVDLEEIKNDINLVLNTKLRVLPESLYDYFRYAGGWFAAPDRAGRDNGVKLRYMFKRLADLVSERL